VSERRDKRVATRYPVLPMLAERWSTRSFDARLRPASSARRRPCSRRWIESSTRMLLSSSSPKQMVRPLIVMKLTDRSRK